MSDITDVREDLSSCREEAERAWAIVDLQSKELDAHQAERMALLAEVDRLRYRTDAPYPEDDIEDERARLAALVRGLPIIGVAHEMVDRAAVLDIVEEK